MPARSHRRGLLVRSPSERRRKPTNKRRSPTTVVASTSTRRERTSFPTGTPAQQRRQFQAGPPNQRHSLLALLLSYWNCTPRLRQRPSHRRWSRKLLLTRSAESELVRRIAFSSPSSILSPMS